MGFSCQPQLNSLSTNQSRHQVTDFEALTLSRGGRAPCQLELHIFTQEMKAQVWRVKSGG